MPRRRGSGRVGVVRTPTTSDLTAAPVDLWHLVRERPRRSAAAALVLACAIALAVIALGGGADQPRPPAAAPDLTPAPSPAPDRAAPPGVDTTRDASYAAIRPGYPDRVVVPALDVDAPVLPIRAPDRTLVPPADPQVLGWWADGAQPGAATGSALVVGHTVHSGGGALDDLETLGEGDQVLVRSTRTESGEGAMRTMEYAVETVRVYRKGRLAQQAAELFSQEVDGRLVLLTCEDWDGTRYLSNVVVTATPVPPEAPAASGATSAAAIGSGADRG